jgi:DNA-binding NarL/FixJ family response regulator
VVNTSAVHSAIAVLLCTVRHLLAGRVACEVKYILLACRRKYHTASPRRVAATGEHVRKRTDETRNDLTAQEAQISQLVTRGASNQEIGAQLFISEPTVQHHLHKVFRKIGVKSRAQLAQRVHESPSQLLRHASGRGPSGQIAPIMKKVRKNVRYCHPPNR